MLVKKVGRLGFGIALCKCGHLQSDHGSRLVQMEGGTYREYHHGGCCCCDCACKQFTFHRFVSLKEAAQMLLDRPEPVVA
jgi:hypothetical protein